jgi:hypothetical protein
MLNLLAQMEHRDRHVAWIALAQKFEAVLGFEGNVQVQGLGRLDIDLIWADANAARLSQSADRMEAMAWSDMGPRLTLGRLWVLGAYELVRTLDQRLNFEDTGVTHIRRQFERIRIPLAKLEPARRHAETDFGIATPIQHNTDGIGWLTNHTHFLTRRSLADDLLNIRWRSEGHV